MKWTMLTGILLISSLLLTACNEKSPDTAYLKDYTANPQVTSDAKLIEIGDEQTSSKGNVTLVQSNFEQSKLEVGQIKLTFYDVKQLTIEPDVSMIDYFHHLTTEAEFDIVKTFVEVTNTGNSEVQFNPAAAATTSDGHEYTWEDEVFLDELSGTYQAGQTKRGNIGFVLDKSETPRTITLQTSGIFNAQQSQITEGNSIQLLLQP